MQRRAQREQPERAKRLTRVLVCAAAVPVMLVATGCSSDSGPDDGGGDKAASASASASPSPTVQAAAYRTLPEACRALSKKTLEDLAPKAKSGKEGSSDDVASRASCSWSSLDNNGVKGSQFRWLNVSLLRFESDTTRGPGDKLAQEYYDKQVREIRATPGAKGLNAQAVTGTGDEATAVRYDLKKKEGTFKQQTVVVRVENVVVTLDYNGAGLAGDKTPDAAALLADAKKAAKEAVLSVTRANGPAAASGSPSAPASGRPSAPASKAPSASASGKS